MGGRETLSQALKTFLFSLSQGAAASAQFPGARGARAGMAAALGAPFQLREIQKQAELQDQDRKMKIAEFQNRLRQGDIDNAFKLLGSQQGMPGPQIPGQVPVSFPQQGDIPAQNASYPGMVAGPLPAIQSPLGPLQPRSAEEILQQLGLNRRQEAAIEQEFRPPAAPRNIDPNSAEGVQARLNFERQRLAMQPPKEEPKPVPGRDIPLPKDVEEQRNRMNANRAQLNGLSPQQFQLANGLARQFDTSQLVKDYNTSLNQFHTVKTIMDRGLGGPGDLAIVYQFMKALDPSSVVRETEFDAAAKSGNIFAGAYAKYNGYLKANGGFLPEAVKKSFFSILEGKMEVSSKQIKGIYDDFSRRIDVITKQPGTGAQYLTDYPSMLGTTKPKGNPLDLFK